LSSFSTLPYPSIPYAIAARRLDLLEDLARRIQDKGGNALAIAQIKTRDLCAIAPTIYLQKAIALNQTSKTAIVNFTV